MIGGFQYELCAHDGTAATFTPCEDTGPGQVENVYLSLACLALDFLIFHLAVALLPHSVAQGKPRYVVDLQNVEQSTAGGRLSYLRKYDVMALAVAIGRLVLLRSPIAERWRDGRERGLQLSRRSTACCLVLPQVAL